MLLRAPLLLARAASLRSPRPLLSSPRAHAAPSEAASPADLAAAAEASLSEAQPSLSPELAALAAAEARVAAAMAQLAAFEADARREEAARAAAGTADAALALANAELDAADAAAAAAAADRAAAEQAAAAASGPLGFVSALLYRQQAPATQLKASSKWAEPVDEDAERGQSGLAALVSGGAGATSHALPLLLLSGVGGFNPVDAAAVAVSCALFGVVYRYACVFLRAFVLFSTRSCVNASQAAARFQPGPERRRHRRVWPDAGPRPSLRPVFCLGVVPRKHRHNRCGHSAGRRGASVGARGRGGPRVCAVGGSAGGCARRAAACAVWRGGAGGARQMMCAWR